MTQVVVSGNHLPTMSDDEIAVARRLEEEVRQMPQIEMPTDHVLHGGMYARTVMLPAGHVLVGVVVQVETIVIFNGVADVLTGPDVVRLEGYQVIPASAFRKQVYVAHEDCHITAVFATNAQSVTEAEEQATNEASSLLSRRHGSENRITLLG